MIDFDHKKSGNEASLWSTSTFWPAGFYAWIPEKMEMRLFMWLDFYLHFWSVQKPDKETNYVTVLRLLFSTEVSYFFAKSKTTKEILMVLLANLTSYNEWEFTYFFNKWSAGEPPSYLFHCQQGQTTLSFVTSRTHFEGGMVAKKIGYQTRHKSEELWPMRYKHDNLRNVSLFATLVN